MPFASLRALSLYYELHGSGLPLLHISGSGNDLRRSAPAASPLNDHFLGLHYDQRGLGRTSVGDRPPAMVDFAEDAAALCEAVGWDRCHVVGTSFGGMVALELAIRRPDLVDRLVLNCTSPGGTTPSYPLHEIQRLPPVERADAWLPLLDTRYDPTLDEPIPGFPMSLDLLRSWFGASREGGAEQGFARQLDARRHHDVEDRLGRIVAPTLVCCGRYDGIAPVANSEVIAAGIPAARLEVFDGGHAFMVQVPAATERAVAFLRDG